MQTRRVMVLVELESGEPLRVLRALFHEALEVFPGAPDVLRLVQIQLNVIREPKRKPRRARPR